MFPEHLVAQVDNTTSQAKNQHVAMLLAWMVARYKFRTCNMFFLRVGHTHEDIDQFFGMLLVLVLRREKWLTPEELCPLVMGMGQLKGKPIYCHCMRDVH